MKKIALLAAFTLLFVSCQNNDDQQDQYTYPSTLTLTSFTYDGGVRIYSKNGLVTDQEAIARWNLSFSGNHQNWLDRLAKNDFSPIAQVTYINRDILNVSPYSPFDRMVVRRQGDYNVFYYSDTITVPATTNALTPIIDKLGVLKIYRDNNVSSNISYSASRIYSGMIAKGNPNSLAFPYMSFGITRRRMEPYTTVVGSWQSFTNNAFDPEIINQLEDGDTLAVQEATAIYTRQ